MMPQVENSTSEHPSIHHVQILQYLKKSKIYSTQSILDQAKTILLCELFIDISDWMDKLCFPVNLCRDVCGDLFIFIDINECRRYPGRLCAHKCENTPGSYYCSCTMGFKLSSDGRSCEGKALLVTASHCGTCHCLWIFCSKGTLTYLWTCIRETEPPCYLSIFWALWWSLG